MGSCRNSRRVCFDLKNVGLAYDAEIFLNGTAPGHLFDEGRRPIGIELVGHEYPRRIGIGFDNGFDVGSTIRFGSRRAERLADDCAGNDGSPSNTMSRVGDLLTRCARSGLVE